VRPEVRDYYRQLGEATRLDEGRGRLEFLRTWDILTRVLPSPPARILDVCGATGVYAGPLAAAGYEVHVVDPVDEHVAAAAALPGVSAAPGDARALDEPAASADAVLLFGPLYHLVDRADRITAWREAGRVVRPGGVVAGAVISRFASLLDAFRLGFAEYDGFMPVVDGTLASGVHRPDRPDGKWFTTAYFHHPTEAAAEVADAGLALDRLLTVEGPLWMVPDLDRWLAGDRRTALLLDRLRLVEADASLLGAGSHLLAVARSG
jgi:SAM-dependent methyltransferase